MFLLATGQKLDFLARYVARGNIVKLRTTSYSALTRYQMNLLLPMLEPYPELHIDEIVALSESGYFHY